MISKTSIELDEEVLDLLETYEQFREYARATSIKDRRVNIRLNSSDLHDIQERALREGMPYQTLIASVLHKYVTGRLKEV